MKIAFVSDAIYPYHKGGKEKRLYDLSQLLLERGHEVHIYTMNWWNGAKTKKEDGIYLHAVCKKYPLYIGKKRSIKQGVMFGLGCLKLLKEDFDVLDADHMVYFHLWPAKIACSLKGKKFVVTWNEVWGKEYWKSYLGNKGVIGDLMERKSSMLPDKIIAVSDYTANRIEKELNVPRNKIVTIDNGIILSNIDKIKPSKIKSDVIFAGRLLGHKNVNLLLKSINLLKKDNPKIKCTVIGEGPEKKDLKELSRKLGLEKNVKFEGSLEDVDELYARIKSSKVFALPSSREGFGLVAIEANACGIPVVTINHKDNAAKTLINSPHNGFISDFNEISFAENIQKALNSYDDMKPACLKAASKHDWNKSMPLFEETYKR